MVNHQWGRLADATGGEVPEQGSELEASVDGAELCSHLPARTEALRTSVDETQQWVGAEWKGRGWRQLPDRTELSTWSFLDLG